MEDDNKPKVTTPAVVSTSNVATDNKRGRLVQLGILLLIVVVMAISAYVFWYNPSHKVSLTYTYTNSQPGYYIPGSQVGKGVTFNKPSVYTTPNPNENSNSLRGFSQYTTDPKNHQAYLLSRLVAETHDYGGNGPSAGLVKLINQYIVQPDSDGYPGVVRNSQNFARDAFLESGINTTFGSAQPYTNSTIKSNAWKFSVTVTQSAGTVPDQTGELLFIIGQHTAYYFFVSAVTANWNSNQQFFQQVLNSVKIDV